MMSNCEHRQAFDGTVSELMPEAEVLSEGA